MESNLSISPHLNSLLPQFSNQNSQFCPEIPSDELFDVLKKDPITEYEEIYSDFMRFSNSQISVLLLRRVLQNPKIPHEFRSQALYRLIVDSYQILTLNEMEIAVWGFYLEKIVWNDSSSKLDYVLLYSALAAKSSTNPCIAPYLAFLSSKISNFFANYNNWRKRYEKLLDISAKEMNCVYTKLKTPLSEDMIDYNYYVDEILQMSPPYSETKDRENEETEASSRFFPHGKKQQVYDASWNLNYTFEGIILSSNSPEVVTNEQQVACNSIISPILLDRIDVICSEFLNCEVPKLGKILRNRASNPLLRSLANL